MRKYVKSLAAASVIMLMLTGCATAGIPAAAPSDNDEASKPQEVSQADDLNNESTEAAEATEDSSAYDDPKNLPAYSYQGTDEYLGVINDYLIDQAKGYDAKADVFIPFSIIVETDDKNPEDTIVYGMFNIDGYDLLNTTLVSETGSRSFGLFHLKKNEDGTCEVLSAELPEVEEECREVFAPVNGLYEKVTSITDEEEENAREEAIADYINTNGLNITQWQDYGHAPVAVLNAPETPEEANFYKYESPLGYEMTYDLRDYSMSYSDNEDMYGKIEPEDVWTGTLMVVKKTDTDDADAAIAEALSDTDAKSLTSEDATIGEGISCKRAEYDEEIEDGRIFRYVCYAVPANGSTITVVIETTVEKGVSELSVEELEKTFESTLSTFSLL